MGQHRCLQARSRSAATLGALLAMLAAPASRPAAAQTPADRWPVVLVTREHRRHPRMELADLYKLLFQSAFGAEHAVTDSVSAAAWLQREISTLKPGAAEDLFDSLSADGNLVRVNLREYVRRGLPPAALLRAFLATAREPRRDEAALIDGWRAAGELAAKGLLRFDGNQMRRYFEARRAEGFPAVSHSPRYAAAYAPAYRVIDRRLLRATSASSARE